MMIDCTDAYAYREFVVDALATGAALFLFAFVALIFVIVYRAARDI